MGLLVRAYRWSSIVACASLIVAVGCGGGGGSPNGSNPNDKDSGTDGGASGNSGGGGSGGEGSGGTSVGTGSGGSGGSSGGVDSGTPMKACGDLMCATIATCDDTAAAPKCTCPSGYRDVNGDGTRCTDINECAGAKSPCDANATCKNTPGSFTCTCDAPAYTGNGKTCACATGYKKVSGKCEGPNGSECAGNGD
jgi:hypothetical protein